MAVENKTFDKVHTSDVDMPGLYDLKGKHPSSYRTQLQMVKDVILKWDGKNGYLNTLLCLLQCVWDA